MTTTAGDAVRFVICVRNDEYEASLEVRKVYEVVSGVDRDPPDWLRVIDESEEDYLFPTDYFVAIDLSNEAKRKLLE